MEENNDLSKLSNDQLRAIVSNIRPKSDWERFFKDKQIPINIEEAIKAFGKLRNRVTHNKLFSKSAMSP